MENNKSGSDQGTEKIEQKRQEKRVQAENVNLTKCLAVNDELLETRVAPVAREPRCLPI